MASCGLVVPYYLDYDARRANYGSPHRWSVTFYIPIHPSSIDQNLLCFEVLEAKRFLSAHQCIRSNACLSAERSLARTNTSNFRLPPNPPISLPCDIE